MNENELRDFIKAQISEALRDYVLVKRSDYQNLLKVAETVAEVVNTR